jgi:hypothetical protein
MWKEEMVLFPAIAAVETGGRQSFPIAIPMRAWSASTIMPANFSRIFGS